MRISQSVLIEIKKAAHDAFPREACGLVVMRQGEQTYVPLRNLAAAPDQFQLDPSDLLPYVLQRGTIVCFCHSHPTTAALPSEQDVAGYTYEEPHLIYSVRDEEARIYHVNENSWREMWRVPLGGVV